MSLIREGIVLQPIVTKANLRSEKSPEEKGPLTFFLAVRNNKSTVLGRCSRLCNAHGLP